MQHGEILTEIQIPVPPAGTSSAYHKLERKVGDYATAGVAVQLTLDGNGICTAAGIGLTNVNPVPLRASRSEEALLGKPITEESIAAAARYASEDCSPSADLRGSEEYKRAMVAVLVKRMIHKAVERIWVSSSNSQWYSIRIQLIISNPLSKSGANFKLTKMEITVTVNGEQHTLDVEPRILLVHLIRENLNLTGTHIGCDTSNCGACTILLDGKSVKSCTILAVQANGKSVSTIESVVGADGTLHALQEGFKENHALQCGFCTPGMIMRSIELLSE